MMINRGRKKFFIANIKEYINSNLNNAVTLIQNWYCNLKIIILTNSNLDFNFKIIIGGILKTKLKKKEIKLIWKNLF